MRDLETVDIELKLLIEGIYLKYKSDFRQYSLASMRRRVLLGMHRLGCGSISQLQDRILTDTAEYRRLLQYLTVPTTEMFRDPAYFRAIREQVVPILKTYPSVKIWVAGCSTGEELFSLAILLKEEELLARSIIYATDISLVSLEKAENGIFPMEQIQLYTSNYQKAGGKRAFSDYYQAAYGSAKFDSGLLSNVVFADHSLATDSVFAEVQLVSCRNVLIYFNRELQDRVFGLFRDSLSHRGFLGLGSKETLRFSPVAAAFEPFSAEQKIYRRKAAL